MANSTATSVPSNIAEPRVSIGRHTWSSTDPFPMVCTFVTLATIAPVVIPSTYPPGLRSRTPTIRQSRRGASPTRLWFTGERLSFRGWRKSKLKWRSGDCHFNVPAPLIQRLVRFNAIASFLTVMVTLPPSFNSPSTSIRESGFLMWSAITRFIGRAPIAGS